MAAVQETWSSKSTHKSPMRYEEHHKQADALFRAKDFDNCIATVNNQLMDPALPHLWRMKFLLLITYCSGDWYVIERCRLEMEQLWTLADNMKLPSDWDTVTALENIRGYLDQLRFWQEEDEPDNVDKRRLTTLYSERIANERKAGKDSKRRTSGVTIGSAMFRMKSNEDRTDRRKSDEGKDAISDARRDGGEVLREQYDDSVVESVGRTDSQDSVTGDGSGSNIWKVKLPGSGTEGLVRKRSLNWKGGGSRKKKEDRTAIDELRRATVAMATARADFEKESQALRGIRDALESSVKAEKTMLDQRSRDLDVLLDKLQTL